MEIQEIKLDKITPNPSNPNKFSQDTLDKLILDIKKNGLKYPVLVREKEGVYEIIDGEHRVKAFNIIGEKKIKCRVLVMNDEEALKTIINLKRIQGQFDDYEFARALEYLVTKQETDSLSEDLFMGEVEIKNLIKRLEKKDDLEAGKALENIRNQEKIKVFSFKSIGIIEIQQVQKALNKTGILNNPDGAFKELCREYVKIKSAKKKQ